MAEQPDVMVSDVAGAEASMLADPSTTDPVPSPHLPSSSASPEQEDTHELAAEPESENSDHLILTPGEVESHTPVDPDRQNTDRHDSAELEQPSVDPAKDGVGSASDETSQLDESALIAVPTIEQDPPAPIPHEGQLDDVQDPDAMSTIDPRMLLNPKGKGTKRQRTDSPSAESKRPRVEQAKYDPRALLNPKAAASAKSQSQPPSHEEDVRPGMGSMIERMHGIQRREDQPVKTKHAAPSDQQEAETKKSKFNGAGGGSVLSEYVAEKKKEGAMEAGPSAVVDLTDDKEDEDLVITASGPAPEEERKAFGLNHEANRVVCLGKIEEAYANYTVVPSPGPAFAGSSTAWPGIKVVLRRRPGAHNFVVSLVDPTGMDFGQLDIRNAMALVPLLDAPNLDIRIKCRIDPRKKRGGDVAGGPASGRLALNITLFAPRKHAKAIGKSLSQAQNWLRTPTVAIGNYPYENPQTIVPAAPNNRSLPGSSTTYTMTRTQEEIRSDVISMFDSLARSDDIPEMEPNELITTPLLPHQKQALHFMMSREKADSENGLWKLSAGSKWYNIITGIDYKRKPEPVRGGILADMMGLGKTLEILSLIATSKHEAQAFAAMAPPQVGMNANANGGGSDNSSPSVLLRCNSKATLLICPLSTIANWQEQIAAHTKGLTHCIYHGPNRETVAKELAKFDIVITTYQVVSSEYNQSRPLSQIHWFRVVLDEAHMIRSQSTKQSQACCALNAERRWSASGTIVQNRLEDLGALIKFLRVKPFDEKNGFAQYIVTPFKNADPEILPKLRILVDTITIRRQKDKINLPPRHDLVVRLDFSFDERQLFDLFAKDTFRKMQAMTAGRESLAKNDMGHVLKAISRLRLICAHGAELLSDEDMKIAEGMTMKGAIEIDDEDEEQSNRAALTEKQAYSMLNLMRESEIDICALCDKPLGSQASTENSDDEIGGGARDRDSTIGWMTPCFHLLCSSPECLDTYKARLNARTAADSTSWHDFADCPLCNAWVRKSLFELKQSEVDREEAAKARVTANMNQSTAKRIARYGGPHTKVKALIEDLQRNQQWSRAHPEEPPIKSVVFSGWTSYLDLISIALTDQDLAHTRLDGTMTRQRRSDALATFKHDADVHVILISITAGGLGLNLTTGSKAYVMEPQYNPAAEAQAVDRIHRLGQTREVTVTRFVMRDSFEERMLELQQKKRDLADLSMNRNVKLDKHEAARRKLEDLRSLFR